MSTSRIRVTAEYLDPNGNTLDSSTMSCHVTRDGEFATDKAVGEAFAAALDGLSSSQRFSLISAAMEMVQRLPAMPYVLVVGSRAYIEWDGELDFDEETRLTMNPRLFPEEKREDLRAVLGAFGVVDWRDANGLGTEDAAVLEAAFNAETWNAEDGESQDALLVDDVTSAVLLLLAKRGVFTSKPSPQWEMHRAEVVGELRDAIGRCLRAQAWEGRHEPLCPDCYCPARECTCTNCRSRNDTRTTYMGGGDA